MKLFTRTLVLLLTLALLASCTPAEPTPSASPSLDPTPAPILTYDTLVDGTYYIPIHMQPNTVITYGDDVSTYTVLEGGELTADEIAARDDVLLLGIISPEADYVARANTKVTYDTHGFIQNIYYEVPAGSGHYQLSPEHATVSPDPTADALDAYELEQEIKFREERELLICDRWLADDPTRSPLARATFFYMGGSVRDTDTHAGALLLATDEADTQHILRVSTPTDGDGSLLLEALAHTDENDEWRSGENGAGCDAETAAEIIDLLSSADDGGGSDLTSYYIPISGMEFDADSGIVLAMCGYETFLVYIEGTRPDSADYAEPIQLFYSFELTGFTSGQPVGFGIGLLAYNEGYGWSTLEG